MLNSARKLRKSLLPFPGRCDRPAPRTMSSRSADLVLGEEIRPEFDLIAVSHLLKSPAVGVWVRVFPAPRDFDQPCSSDREWLEGPGFP
jgi:hypothetical protein